VTEAVKRSVDGEYCFAIVLKESGKVIGEIAAHPESVAPENDCKDTFSPCWMLNQKYHGKGYAYEAVKKYIDYLKENYNYKYYIARADIRNNPSIKLMKKLNMIYVLTEERVYPDGRPTSEEVEYRLDINKGE
jgi:RimJ/RimL family protein N-acetyltransferase